MNHPLTSIVLALFGSLFLHTAADARRPNVILIVADDLGYGELGCYGQKKIRTPHLDRMAKEGLRFTQFYAGSPVCAPSRCCLMTGKHGGHAWVRDNREVKPEGQTPVPTSEVMLPELMKKLGYATGAVGKWGLGFPGSEADPIRRGFDLFYGYNCQRHAHSHYPTYLWRNDRREPLPENNGKTGTRHSQELFEREALAFVRAHRDDAFFLYLPFTIPHVAIQTQPAWLEPYRGQWDDPPYDGKKGYQPHPAPRAGYAAMITRLDTTVGRLLDLLAELKLADTTLVLFTSDNGATHDVGGADTEFFASVGPLRDRKGRVYEGGIRVPLLARWPKTIAAGRTTDLPAYFPDVLPTLLDTAGAADRIPAAVDGLSLLPTLRGQPERQKRHEFLLWEFAGYGGQQAIRIGDWKGVRIGLQKKKAAPLELYNLKDDLGETTDVAEQHPEMVRRMMRLLSEQRVPSKLFPIKGLGDR